MPNIREQGYLEDGYTVDPYGSGQVFHGVWSQVDRRIDNNIHRARSQVSRAITTPHRSHEQIAGTINTTHRIRSQIQEMINSIHLVLESIDRNIGTTHRVSEQANRAITSLHRAHEQVSRGTMAVHAVHSQVDRKTLGTHAKHSQIKRGSVLFLTCGVYLEGDYLEDPYLAPMYCAHVREQVLRDLGTRHTAHSQVNRRIDKTHRINSQIQRRLDKLHRINEQIKGFLTHLHPAHSQVEGHITNQHRIKHEQIERRIDKLHRVAEQINRLSAKTVHEQITQVLYNTTNLRILLDFPSRGTSGVNWTASSTATGDFSVNNLNTDIVEEVWRSATGVKTGITLTCDTEVPQGVFVDTLALLNTNFTTSASIVWQASTDPGFATVGFTQVLASTRTNVYYIAPTLPTDAFRYHRFIIDDNTNTNASLQIGTIVFGSSIIFQGECFVDQVTRQTVHFADKIATEAFTNVANDRALKFAVGLEFRNLELDKGNYSRIRDVFETARTSFKCLWIPTPQYASRYAVFGKLETIPVETHNDLGVGQDYVSFSIQVDESL